MITHIVDLGVGIVAGLLTAFVLRLTSRIFDFVPRKLTTLGIGTSFEPFRAWGPGDTYNDIFRITIRNHGAHPLYIVRCVYFRDTRKQVPVYVNAARSQKYPRGYEAKFGNQWLSMQWFIPPNEEIMTYIPLNGKVADDEIPQGKRGKLLIEYVYDGSTGIHKARL